MYKNFKHTILTNWAWLNKNSFSLAFKTTLTALNNLQYREQKFQVVT